LHFRAPQHFRAPLQPISATRVGRPALRPERIQLIGNHVDVWYNKPFPMLLEYARKEALYG